jgi:hypothetical protein
VGVAILFKPTGLRFHEEDAVIKLLSDSSLWFETCLIMRAEDRSRAVNESRGIRSCVRSKLKCPVFIAHDLSGFLN